MWQLAAINATTEYFIHNSLYLSLCFSLSICISIFTWDFFSALQLDRYIDSAPSRQAPCCLIHIHLLCCAVASPLVIPSICIVSLPQNTLPPSLCVCVCLSLVGYRVQANWHIRCFITFRLVFGQLTTFLRLLCMCICVCVCKFPIPFTCMCALVARVLWFLRSLTRYERRIKKRKEKNTNISRPKN